MIDVKKMFETDLPNALISKAKEVQAVNACFQVNITGSGSWFIDATPKGPTCLPGQGKADCSITISTVDFQSLMKEPSKAITMMLFGKLKIVGDKALAMKLTKLLDLK